MEIQKSTPNFTKRTYQQYVLALHLFLKKQTVSSREKNGRISKSLELLKAKRSKLISQRADMISAHAYDLHSQEEYEGKISELSESIEGLQAEKHDLKTGEIPKHKSFVQFLELTSNLHHYWLAGDMQQKEQISKNLLWNLTIEGVGVRSIELKTPFSVPRK